MNNFLKQQMSDYFMPEKQSREKTRGGSSLEYTAKLRKELQVLFKKYNIKSMFDAGCNDCSWMSTIIEHLDYHGGDISQPMVTDAQHRYPELDIVLHDITTDQLPKVDLLFIKDVTIHLDYADKKKVIQNWLASDIPWIMLTHDECEKSNLDFDYATGFPFEFVNWVEPPWDFPAPTEVIHESGSPGRCMALWNRDQLCQ